MPIELPIGLPIGLPRGPIDPAWEHAAAYWPEMERRQFNLEAAALLLELGADPAPLQGRAAARQSWAGGVCGTSQ